MQQARFNQKKSGHESPSTMETSGHMRTSSFKLLVKQPMYSKNNTSTFLFIFSRSPAILYNENSLKF